MVDVTLGQVKADAKKDDQADEVVTNRFLEEALRENKREGLELAVKARVIALIIVGVFTAFLVGDWSALYYEALIFLFILNGFAQLKFGRVGRSRLELLLLAFDLALMTITLVVPNPFSTEPWTPALQYWYGNFSYFYILMAGATLAYSWKTMFAVSWYTVLFWFVGYAWLIHQPDPLPEVTMQVREVLKDYPDLLELVDPYDVPLHMRIQEVLIFCIVAGILAVNSWRSNRLLLKQADAARERSNLARYFAPSIVEHLAGRDKPLGEVRAQSVVVMFVDIVGFTKMAEQQAPSEVVDILREFHKRMETAVFNNMGTLDKFLGDGIMATFGTPVTSPNDAANSLNCAAEMQESMKAWNGERSKRGLPEIRLSIGLHCGEVVLGDIGSERRLEFAVLGDVVNVSSRLEALTREIGTSILVSDAVVQEAGGEEKARAAGLVHHGETELRGRDEPVNVWKAA